MKLPARRAAMLLAAQYARQRPVFLDTETTGLDPRAEIVEISLVDTDGAVLLDSLVRPTRSIPLDAIQVHGISNSMVQGAPAWPEVWPAIERLLEGRLVGIYNAEFDLRMLRQSHAAHRIPWQPPGFLSFCVMKLYAQYRGEASRSYGSYRWHSLEAAGRQCGLQLLNTHRALADTQLARAVFEHMLPREE
jgi:DNA polymerase-3 subunit epsilon